MQNVDRGCFVETNPYKICSMSTKSDAIILPPFVEATILEALHDYIKDGSHSLIMERGSGYLSACVTFMSGISGRTESTLPDNKLAEAALGNFAKWLQYTKKVFTLGTQIIFRSVSDHKPWSSNSNNTVTPSTNYTFTNISTTTTSTSVVSSCTSANTTKTISANITATIVSNKTTDTTNHNSSNVCYIEFHAHK
ncbi:unnamed protein product [Trichobilharzia szidati]|nr:unnamed protein product [Trichobilharzia szidati]